MGGTASPVYNYAVRNNFRFIVERQGKVIRQGPQSPYRPVLTYAHELVVRTKR